MPVAKPKKEEPKVDVDDLLRKACDISYKVALLKPHAKWTEGKKKALTVLQTGDVENLLKLAKRTNDTVYEGGMTFDNFYDAIEHAHHEQVIDEASDDDDMGDVGAAMADDFDIFGGCEMDDEPAPVKKEEPKPEKKAAPVEEAVVKKEEKVVQEETKEEVKAEAA